MEQTEKCKIGAAEVQCALSKAVGPNVTLKSFRFKPPPEGAMGYMGEHRILEVEYQEARISYQATTTLTFFMKSIPQKKTFQDLIIKNGIFAKEREIFEKLLPLMSQSLKLSKLSVPECYLISENNYMLFEDLSRLNFKLENRFEFLGLEHCKALIEAVAQLHAGSIATEAKTGKLMTFYIKHSHETVITNVSKDSTNIARLWHNASLSTTVNLLLKLDYFSQRVQKVSKEELIKRVAQVWDQAVELAAGFSSTFSNVLSHGDLWTTNFMFKQIPGGRWKAVLVDFQTYRYAPPILDLLSFLHMTTSRKFRWNHQSELLRYYHSSLLNFLKKAGVNTDLALSLEELEKSAFELRLFGVAIAAR
jgi:hypothetical protein